jgi:hypothetical protein
MFVNVKRTTLLQLERHFEVDCIVESNFSDTRDGADHEGARVGLLSDQKPHLFLLQPASPFVTDIEN